MNNKKNRVLRAVSTAGAACVLLVGVIWITIESVYNSVYSAISAYDGAMAQSFLLLKITVLNFDTVRTVLMCLTGLFICCSVTPLLFADFKNQAAKNEAQKKESVKQNGGRNSDISRSDLFAQVEVAERQASE